MNMTGKDNRGKSNGKTGETNKAKSYESEAVKHTQTECEGDIDNNQTVNRQQTEKDPDATQIRLPHETRIHPTLPNLLTKYGLQEKDTVQVKRPTRKRGKKKAKSTFEDEDEKEKERDRQKEAKHLEIFHDMTKLRNYYYNQYMSLLHNKVQKQRQEIQQRAQAMNEKEDKQKHIKRPERHQLSSDTSYLEKLPKTDVYFIVQLQDKLVREGKLRTQSDLDAFWRRMQQPEVFYAQFKTQKSSDWSGGVSINLMHTTSDDQQPLPAPEELGPKTLSRIMESRESLPASAPSGQGWSVTQQFPAMHRTQHRKSLVGSKHPQSLRRSSFVVDLEKRFPKLEMPRLHCFTMDLGPKLPNPDEVTHQRHLRHLEKRRLAHMRHINKMHQMAMSHFAATNRLLSKSEDLHFLLDGHQLTDLIPEHMLCLDSPHQQALIQDINQTESLDWSQTESLPVSYPTLNHPDYTLEDHGTTHQDPNLSIAYSSLQDGGTIHPDLVISTDTTTEAYRMALSGNSKWKSYQGRKSNDDIDGGTSIVLALADKPHTSPLPPIPLSLGEVMDKGQIMEAKCLSTLWTNYMKERPDVQS